VSQLVPEVAGAQVMASAVDRCTGSVGARMVGGGGENKDE